MSTVAAIALGTLLMGGGAIGLAPGDQPDLGEAVPASPAAPSPGPAPVVPDLMGAAALALLVALAQRRAGGLAPGGALGLQPSPDPLFVFIPGHGQSPGARSFEDLIDLMGLEPSAVRHFDYRWVAGTEDHGLASRLVSVDDSAAALNSFLAGVATEGRSMYLIGFSKGGAALAELIADWDDGLRGPSDSVIGAALLDPPIAAGAQGWAQSLGRHLGPIPDDGGYEPVRCGFLRFSCDDRRQHLGRAAGVEVIVVRNPKAAITSFSDVPDGLRVYDAADDGPGPWQQLLRNPLGLPSRVAAAHEAVLNDPRVASCLLAEATTSGSCDLPRRRPDPGFPGLNGGSSRAPVPQKVL